MTIATLATAAALVPAGADGATIEVDTTNDELNADGDCSVREAVQAANTNQAVSGCVKGQASQSDTVKLEPGEQYVLDIASTDEDANANGDLDITGGGPVTIKGNSRGMLGPAIYASAGDRAIDALEDTGPVTIKKLNLEGENAYPFTGGVVRTRKTDLTVDDVNMEHGSAAAGGAIATFRSTVAVSDSFIGQNDAVLSGGGIAVDAGRSLTVKRSGLDSNDVTGGTVNGGGIASSAKETTVADTELEFNSAETTINGGLAAGGGIDSASEKFTIRRSLIEGNDASDAGGTSLSLGAGVNATVGVTVVNSTFFDNDAEAFGGAVYAPRGSISHATFQGNDGPDGGDHVAVPGPSSGVIKLRNSLFDDTIGTGDTCLATPGQILSKGHNVAEEDDPQCAFRGSDEIVVDTGISDGTPLPHGGETFTMAIAGSSPAKDEVPLGKCDAAQGEDQRGYKRPKGSACDAGAYERGAKP